MLPGISLSVGGDSQTGNYSVTYTGPGAPSGITWGGAGWASVNATVQLFAEIVYSIGGSLRYLTTLNVLVNGVKQTDLGISGDVAIESFSGGLGPSYFPLRGISFGGQGQSNATTIDLPGTLPEEPKVYEYCSECEGTHFIGWRIKGPDDEDWESLPITLAPGGPPAMGGGCDDPGVGSVSAGETYGATIGSFGKECKSRQKIDEGAITECKSECTCPNGSVQNLSQIQDPPVPWQAYAVSVEETHRAANVRLLPNLDRAINRFNDDFLARLVRDEFPEVKGVGAWSCDNNGVLSSGTAETLIHAHLPHTTGSMTNSPSAIEDALNANCYGVWGVSGTKSTAITYEYDQQGDVLCADADCPAPGPGEPPLPVCVSEYIGGWEVLPPESYNANRSYQSHSIVGTDIVPYLDHAEGLARYVNSWANPHWSYALPRDDWSGLSFEEYWELVGSQWLTDGSDGIFPRNHLVSEPLASGGLNEFLDTFYSGQRWVGVSRFQAKACIPRASYTYDEDSSSLWESEDGSLSFDSEGVTVTPS